MMKVLLNLVAGLLLFLALTGVVLTNDDERHNGINAQFELVSSNGETVTEQLFIGKNTLGYRQH